LIEDLPDCLARRKRVMLRNQADPAELQLTVRISGQSLPLDAQHFDRPLVGSFTGSCQQIYQRAFADTLGNRDRGQSGAGYLQSRYPEYVPICLWMPKG
jgi:hypothetical protein